MNKKDFFDPSKEIFEASAPGRMDIMGGIADYSGSLLLQMPIKQKTTVSLQKREDNILRLYSTHSDFRNHNSIIELNLNALAIKKPTEYQLIRNQINIQTESSWVLYVVGCFIVAYEEKLINLTGANVIVESDIPLGKGVSSSAALEVSTLKVLEKAYNFSLKGLTLPVLAQKVENHIVGAPCGLMDQLSSFFGLENKLLPIICQPAKIFAPITIPEPIMFIGIDSGVRHAIGGNSYSQVRAAAFMGYSIIASSIGISAHELKKAKDSGNWESLPFHGYLANITTEEFESAYLKILPDQIKGIEFLEKYKFSIDNNTKIDPEVSYSIRSCTAHPIFENERILKFKKIIEQGNQVENLSESTLKTLGQLMIQSHYSYSSCGLGNQATDQLVEMVTNSGTEFGVYGARVTGGGSGGTVCVLAYKKEGLDTAKKIWFDYQKKSGKQVTFFGPMNMPD